MSPHSAALLFALFLIAVSAHADTEADGAVARALADPRRPAEQVRPANFRVPRKLDVIWTAQHARVFWHEICLS